MKTAISIPIFIEKVAEEGAPGYYSVAPLFFRDHLINAEREDVAVERLTESLRQVLVEWVKSENHQKLSQLGFVPELARHHLKLMIRLRKKTFEGKFFFAVFEEFGRRLAFAPKIPEICFEWPRGDSLEDRAREVLTEHFRNQEREDGGADPEASATNGFGRIGYVDVETTARQKIKLAESSSSFAEIGGGEEMDGSMELERVGRCLDRLFPKRLQRAILREELVGELLDLFTKTRGDVRPVVIVGKSQVGKTAVIHEFVYRRLDGKQLNDQVWLLNPQRLVSGMSFVGQWEGRFLAIMKHVRKQKHILVFDDLLGMFQAGKSQESDLTVGHLLKAQLEEHQIPLLVEATPESWRKLKELDRGFTDLFQVIPLREPSDEETLRILIRVMQTLECDRKCRFSPDVIPQVMQLQRRYVRTRAFPGKGAEFLNQLATSIVKDEEIGCEDVLRHFRAKTGISAVFLDDTETMDRREVEAFFCHRIVGQKAGVGAMIDAVSMSKARLNDPARPLSTLLFLGPTGVGKTECARALAEFIFGSSERMLRFDMNEFVGPDATMRLIGSEGRPQGLLTTAIRRQPYTVLLMDEVEKAHPDVFDLLLQVLGEGRLTDAAGQTADFCNAVIILTSNLGARKSRVPLGFAEEGKTNSQIYVEAAENFFRPEFFNRLDRVVPFHELDRSHIAGMVEKLTLKALNRYGLRQRNIMLDVDREVYDMLTDHGFDPEYGARALRRAIEDHLVQPLARTLASSSADALASVRIELDEHGKPALTSSGFVEAKRSEAIDFVDLDPEDVRDVLDAANAFVQRADERLDVISDALDDDFAAMAPYYTLREELNVIRRMRDRLLGSLENHLDPRNGSPPSPSRFGRRASRLRIPRALSGEVLAELGNATDAGVFLKHLAGVAEIQSSLAFETENFVNSLSRLNLLLEREMFVDSACLKFSGNMPLVREGEVMWRENPTEALRYFEYLYGYARTFQEGKWNPERGWSEMFYNIERGDDLRNHLFFKNDTVALVEEPLRTYQIEGIGLRELLNFEKGTHLFYRNDGGLTFAEVQLEGTAAETEVLRIHHECGLVLDLRTGLITADRCSSLWSYLDPLLPVIPELQSVYPWSERRSHGENS